MPTQLPVKSLDFSDAPENAEFGDRYIVPNYDMLPGDPWENHNGEVAWFDGLNWNFEIPEIGWEIFIEDRNQTYTFGGTFWSTGGTGDTGSTGSTGSTGTIDIKVDRSVYVDKTRSDQYTSTGSLVAPFKTIQEAINYICSIKNNTIATGHIIKISPGEYSDTIILHSEWLENIVLCGTDEHQTILTPSDENSLISEYNNLNLKSIVFENLTFKKPIRLVGEHADTNFGKNECVFINCDLTDVYLKNINRPIIKNSKISGCLVLSNVTSAIISSPHVINEIQINSYQDQFKPNLWSSNIGSDIQLIGCQVNELNFNNDDKILLTLRNGCLIRSTTCRIPNNVKVYSYNSLLYNDWTVQGELILSSGSFITGELIKESGCSVTLEGQTCSQMMMGPSPDGLYNPGIVDINTNSNVSQIIDDFNNIIKTLAPTESDRLTDIDLTSNPILKIGKIPSGLSTDWYLDATPGDILTNISGTPWLNISSGIGASNATPTVGITNSTRFRKGNIGLLKVIYKAGNAQPTIQATLDIDANFNSTLDADNNYPVIQDINLWDNSGIGNDCQNGKVTFLNTAGQLEIIDVRRYNNFNAWQKMNCSINTQSLMNGRNEFILVHTYNDQIEQSHPFVVHFDPSNTEMLFSTIPSVSLKQGIFRYLSGIQYYNIGTKLTINFIAENIYKSCYHPTNVCKVNISGVSQELIINPTTTPNVNSNLSINKDVILDSNDIYLIDGNLKVTLFHPWKTSIINNTPKKLLINTVSSRSTNLIEYFVDEKYRLPNGDYNVVPESIIDQWDSNLPLTNGNALLFNQKVQYPIIDLRTYIPPSLNFQFTNNQVYLRAFASTDPHSNVTLILPGLNSQNIAMVGNGDINIEVKLPGITGWLDGGKQFNLYSFTGIDGDGCFINHITNNRALTFSTFSTANSEMMIIVRITFRNNNCSISSGFGVSWLY